MRSISIVFLVSAFVAVGCGGGGGGSDSADDNQAATGTRAPGTACDESSIDDALACQAAPGTECHTCINPHGPGVPTSFIGYCVYSCNPSAPSCPAGQACAALPDDTGWLSRGCAAELTGYCH